MNNISANTNETDKKVNVGAIIKGSIISIIVSFLAFLILAFVLLFSNIPEQIVGIGAVILSVLSVFLGGYISARISKQKGWLYGAICGLIYYVILYISALSAIKDFNFSLKTLVMMLIGTLAGMVGGMLGVNSAVKKRRR